MELYLIRHGETEISKKRFVSGPVGQLNELGIKQAKCLATKLKSKEIDLVLTSPYQRSKKTAKILADILNIKVVVVSLLKEKRLPSEVEGERKNDNKSRRILKLLQKHELDIKWRYSDEENLNDILYRVKKFLKYLKKNKNDRLKIVIVSHKYFLMTLLFMLKYRCFNFFVFQNFYKKTKMEKGQMYKRIVNLSKLKMIYKQN